MGSAEADATRESSDEEIGRRTTSRNRVVEWVLVDGNRLLLAGVASVAVFALLLGLHGLGLIGFTNDGSVTRMASGMIAGTFSLVTLVVSVNQLILSQELSPAGRFRDRLEGVLSFRRDVEDAAGVPAPPVAPTRLLELLAETIRHRADALGDAVADHGDEASRERIRRYARDVIESTQQMDTALKREEVNTFEALSTAVEYEDAWQLYAARYLRNDTPRLSPETERAFDDLVEVLRLFDTSREHFKTVYLQRELTRFSQLTIYTGLPALLAALLIALLYGEVGGAAISAAYLPYVTSLLATIVFVPLALLASYILRTATLTRRTATIGPILPEKHPDDGPFDAAIDESE